MKKNGRLICEIALILGLSCVAFAGGSEQPEPVPTYVPIVAPTATVEPTATVKPTATPKTSPTPTPTATPKTTPTPTPTVRPTTPVDDVIPEEIQDEVPIVVETKDKAVEAVYNDEANVAVVVHTVTYVDKDGVTRNALGFNVVNAKTNTTEEEVKTAKTVDVIPDEALKMISVSEAKVVLTQTEYQQFMTDIQSVAKLEDNIGGKPYAVFWFRADEDEGGNVAKLINKKFLNTETTPAPTAAPTTAPTAKPTTAPTATVKPTATPRPTTTVAPTQTPAPTTFINMNYSIKYTFACKSGGEVPRVYLNGVLLPLVDNKDGTYTVLLSETGSVIIYGDVDTTPILKTETMAAINSIVNVSTIKAETAAEAVKSVSPESPLVCVANEVTTTDENGNTVTGAGFNVVTTKDNITETDVKNAQVVDSVPVESIQMITMATAAEELSDENYLIFLSNIDTAVEVESGLGGAVISAFYFKLDEDIGGQVASYVNSYEFIDDVYYGISYTFACQTNGTLPRVYLNGVSIPVVDNGNGTYTVILTEEGPVVVAVDSLE